MGHRVAYVNNANNWEIEAGRDTIKLRPAWSVIASSKLVKHTHGDLVSTNRAGEMVKKLIAIAPQS